MESVSTRIRPSVFLGCLNACTGMTSILVADWDWLSANALSNAITARCGLNPKWAWARHSTFHYRSARMTEPVYIFLAEDNPGDVDLLEEALHEHKIQHKLFIAKNGTEAKRYIDRLGKHPDAPCPDFILLDLNLPIASGFEIFSRFRQH